MLILGKLWCISGTIMVLSHRIKLVETALTMIGKGGTSRIPAREIAERCRGDR
jgi:hypothetical protein